METNLYRKYRPTNFDQVVGQQVVVRTLINSIKNLTIAHAYLFSGVRGTGKTSIAKIFAKAINCQNTDNPLCGECEMCQEMLSQSEMPDIFEIDAASNNGVEEIRKIIDNVKYMPIRTKYKVYIIDEVHMLSKGAFNALLKTLEEPPSHVIFILATTEPNKIPVTILSRVQRFDFTRIDEQLMFDHLCNVLDKEQIEYDQEAIKLIVTHAQGGLRDGLSLLTKVISFAKAVTVETVTQSLNLAAKSVSYDLLQAIVDNESQQVSDDFKTLIAGGVDEAYLVQDLIEVAKDKLMISLSDGGEDVAIYTKIITRLMETLANIKIISNSALYIEIALIELSVKPKEMVQFAAPQPTKVKAPVVSEQTKVDKLKEQAELLKQASEKETVKPAPVTVNTPKTETKVDEVDLQMDILFSNKTGKDVEQLKSQLEPALDPKQLEEVEHTVEEQQPVIEEQPTLESEQPTLEVEHTNDEQVVIEEQPTLEVEPIVEEEQINDDITLEPVEQSQSIASSIAKPVEAESKVEAKPKVRSELDDITIIDTLKAATKQDKQKSLMAGRKAADDLNRDKQYGIAKFFEVSTVQGASSTGIVVSVDQNFYTTYESRSEQIQQIYSRYIGSSVKLHLITTQYWKQERMNFVRAVKANKEVDIFQEAADFFGKDIVNKVNTWYTMDDIRF